MKKTMIFVSCIAMVLGTMLFTKGNTILAASIRDTFVEGDFTYEVTDLGDTTTNGKVEIKDYDETSETTNLVIAETVDYNGKTYDIVSSKLNAFSDADKVKTLHISKNFITFNGLDRSFLKLSETDFILDSSLETITVDESNPVFKVIDGVLYDMTNDNEEISLYPYNANKTEYIVPDFIVNSNALHAVDNLIALQLAKHLESIEMPFEEKTGIFTENGMLCGWKNRDDHTQGMNVYMIPQGMKRVVFSENTTDLKWVLGNGMYYLKNNATEFVVEGTGVYKSIDGCLYQGDTLLLYPGGRTDTVYRIKEGTKAIGGITATFFGNRYLKNVIIPSSVTSVDDYGIISLSLKSVKIEGTGNINWNNGNFSDPQGGRLYSHIYVDNGNTTTKQQIQATIPHLTDDYFHELGAVPTTNITNVKTTVENSKDIKVSWSATRADTNFEVRRYDADGTYKVIGSTTEASFIDTTTKYNTTYQYEVVPYNFPVTSSTDSDDAFREYHTYGTASNKESITTPVQKFKGIYTYKLADGTQGSIAKDVKKGESVANNAPALPEVKGYVFDKWTSDLLNIEVVDKDFTATAIYKKVDAPVDNDKPDNNNPDISKPSNDEKTPSDTRDTVITGDQTSIAMSLILMITAGTILIVVTRKRHHKI